MNEHTPTPWQITTYSNYEGFSIHSVHDPKFGCIAERWEKNVKEDRNGTIYANANFIVEACNNYDRLANLEQVNAALLAVAESVIAAYDEHIRNYSEVRKNWNDQMPGNWPVQLCLTMEDVRKARAAIELAKQPDIDPVTKKPFNKD